LQRRHGDARRDHSAWVPPVLRLVASENQQVPELAAAVDEFVAWSERTGRRRWRTRERAYAQVVRALAAMLLAPYARTPGSEAFPASVEPWIERIMTGAASPLEAAQALIRFNEEEAS
jgi:LAO/AO transport system kinase